MSETEPPSKKLRASAPEPFKTQSDSGDIHLKFDDGTILYVHPAFLSLMSPVFKSMFQHDCQEKITRTVDLPGKKSEDFLEFLMCLHPCIQNPVDHTNVLRIVGIAYEYKVSGLQSKCEATMMSWLLETESVEDRSENNIIRCLNLYDFDPMLKQIIVCLDILDIAITLNITELKDTAIQNVARFGFELYTKETREKSRVKESIFSDSGRELHKECRDKFEKIPDSDKAAIFLERLKYIDDNQFVGAHQNSEDSDSSY